jgi:hypothetical protein
VRIRAILAIGIASVVACSAPAPTVSASTATPTVAPTTSPQPASVVPSATATAIPAIVSGAVYWGQHAATFAGLVAYGRTSRTNCNGYWSFNV